MALAKAGNRKKLLINVHQAFCDFSIETGALERAREHLLSLSSLVDERGKVGVRAQILGLELRSSRIKEASDLLNNELKVRDLSESDIIVQQVNAFLADKTEGKDPRAVVHSILKEMQATDARPKWERVRSVWLSEDGTLPETVVDTNSPS